MDTPMASLKFIVLGLAVINLFLAALFLRWSKSLVRANKVLKKWISTEKIEKALNSVRDIDSNLMKMQRVIGLVCMVLAVIFMFLYIRRY